jgi:carboxypeptidase Ss1
MILVKHRDELSGAVKFLFQPAEEHGGRGGAKPMIEDGAMQKPTVDYVFGLHIMYDYPSGTFALKGGALMAAPDSFKIRIIGRGGHGSAPHQAIDPVYAAAQVVTSLQGLSGRMVDPIEPFVISVCSIHSGTRHNIIPDEAVLEGTLRTLNERTRRDAKSAIPAVAKAVCSAFGAKCEVEFMEDAYPITYNDPIVTKTVFEVLRSIKGTKTVEASPILGGEDFSRFLERAPGAFYFLGTRNAGKGCTYPNHSARFKIDEDVLKYGSASLALLALEFTKQVRSNNL